jgi:AcrR family transcriptional regulator
VTREQQILAAAEKLFSERSFDGVGVDAIGKEAGVTGSAIYRHFANKDEILSALFDQATDALLRRIGEPLADPRDELNLLVKAHIEFAVGHPGLANIWIREQRALTSIHQRNFHRRRRHYLDRWIDALDQCYPGHRREDLIATFRALDALITSDTLRPAGTKQTPRLSALLTNLVFAALEGLAPR